MCLREVIEVTLISAAEALHGRCQEQRDLNQQQQEVEASMEGAAGEPHSSLH